jgi:peptide deformylase
MKKAVDACKDGVAIAAPQIGKSLRIFVVSPKAFGLSEEEIKTNKDVRYPVFINPKIINLSSKKKVLDEGCLSVKNNFGKIKRSEKATIEAYDETGKKIMRGGSGLIAEIFQHETDHLDGKLFIDTAKNLIETKEDGKIEKVKIKTDEK